MLRHLSFLTMTRFLWDLFLLTMVTLPNSNPSSCREFEPIMIWLKLTMLSRRSLTPCVSGGGLGHSYRSGNKKYFFLWIATKYLILHTSQSKIINFNDQLVVCLHTLFLFLFLALLHIILQLTVFADRLCTGSVRFTSTGVTPPPGARSTPWMALPLPWRCTWSTSRQSSRISAQPWLRGSKTASLF